jgi:hypothetical protein
MKLEDVPTAIQTVVTDLAVLIEVNQKLAIAVAALKEAIDAGTYVVQLCEDNVKCGDSPNPSVKADWVGTVAHCYAAMNFLPKARKALAQIEEKK